MLSVQPGRPENMYKCIICDPDERRYEGQALGLLYTALSRATTLGDENGLDSAIYFNGPNFKKERIFNLYNKKNSIEEFTIAQNRRLWVERLQKHTVKTKRRKETVQRIVQWVKTDTYSYDDLYSKIQKYTKSKTNGNYGKRKHN